ncbi:glycosyltransferase [Hymenobacter coccineus]|uniref:glycosyltransferase n=1 Tax=Hymenobacter coccineus TaxID=1908235 RepID=UPI000F7738CD|nr:glycosyltransferase [Hymenobacter coccineus]
MQQPTISFMISTFNKVDYLKLVLTDLINNIQADEEIVVVDGGSTDGSVEFLQNLADRQLIHAFISEKDSGEGHGFNKAILLSKGKIVTFLTDDDAFNYEGLRVCKAFMLEHPKLDFLFTGGADYQFQLTNTINYFTPVYEEWVKEYALSSKAFSFCMLGSMMNKSSLPLLGLINPTIRRADAEFSLRITFSKIKIAFYPPPCYVRILNNNSNSAVFSKKIKEETEMLNALYGVYLDGPPPQLEQTTFLKHIKNIIRPLYRTVFPVTLVSNTGNSTENSTFHPFPYIEAYAYAKEWLKKKYHLESDKFISNL